MSPDRFCAGPIAQKHFQAYSVDLWVCVWSHHYTFSKIRLLDSIHIAPGQYPMFCYVFCDFVNTMIRSALNVFPTPVLLVIDSAHSLPLLCLIPNDYSYRTTRSANLPRPRAVLTLLALSTSLSYRLSLQLDYIWVHPLCLRTLARPGAAITPISQPISVSVSWNLRDYCMPSFLGKVREGC